LDLKIADLNTAISSKKDRVHHLERDGHEAEPFTEEQIIGILREQEAGAKMVDVCCKHGISSADLL
jgi:hypothetical protein